MHPKLKSLFLSLLPPAPFPCGLIKARQALEKEQLGQKMLLRGLREHGDDAAKWNESTEGTVRQTELEQSAVGENETLKDAFGQSMHMEGDAGQTEMAGGASSWNKTLVDSLTQKPLGDGAAGQEAGAPEHDEAVVGTTRPGKPGRGPAPWSELTQGSAWQNETTAPAARQKEMVENAAGQNQTGAIQTVRDELNQSSDWGNVSDRPRFVQIKVSSTSEHSDSRITGGTLCHRGHCPWQVILFLSVWP